MRANVVPWLVEDEKVMYALSSKHGSRITKANAAFRFSVTDYYRMVEVGILQEGDRVELIDGQVLAKEPGSPPHAGNVNALNRAFMRALGERAVVTVQSPIHVDDYNEPEPDLTVCRPRRDLYSSAHPEPADVLLVIESSLTSLTFDRRKKWLLYARAGIPEYWILDIRSREVEVHREPTPNGYGSRTRHGLDDVVSPLAFEDVQIAVTELFPS